MAQSFNLTLDIPDNLKTMTHSELIEWAGDRIKPAGKFTSIQVLNIMNNIFI